MSDKYPVGQRVGFDSGNFSGMMGTVISVDDNSKAPEAIYGFIILVMLDSGRKVMVEKSEHIRKLKHNRHERV